MYLQSLEFELPVVSREEVPSGSGSDSWAL
jgi:hypothetical protein